MRTKVTKFERALRERVHGEVRFDHTTRVLYSTDASNYQIMPVGVVIPLDTEDVRVAVEIAAAEGVAVLPRGAGTSLSGQTVGMALVIDFTKYMNRILEIDPERRIARVQPGLVLAQLNEALKPYSLIFGPDPASGSRCSLGGMIGNNSCGAHSLVYGKTSDHIISLNCMLSDGRIIEFGPNSWNGFASSLRELVEKNRELILSRYPNIPRCVSGYNLGELVRREEFNLAGIIVGSEGTLAIATEAEIKLSPIPKHEGAVFLAFPDKFASLDAVPQILELNPRAIEMVDDHTINAARSAPAYTQKAAIIPKATGGLLTIEFGGETEEEVRTAIARLLSMCPKLPSEPKARVMTPQERLDIAGSIRQAALGLAGRMVGDAKPIGFVEDTGVPPEKLGDYARKLEEIAIKHGTHTSMYGHAGQGCLHIKPTLDLMKSEGVAKMRAIAEEVSSLVIEFGGSLSGEHGDGLSRSEFLPKMFGPEIMDLHRQIKNLFDPVGIMNPGKIIDPLPMDQNLRYGPGYSAIKQKTYFDFSSVGGYHRAIEFCNGLGECRKLNTGTMCPSYMVTMDEMHTTRARANAIRAALSAGCKGSALKEALEVLDLCLQCKACKNECPISVDMATCKAEFLAQYHKTYGTPLSTRVFGMIDAFAAMGTRTPWLANWVMQGPFSGLVKRLGNIHPDRPLPALAPQNFRSWFRKLKKGVKIHGRRYPEALAKISVLLFDDAFNSYFDPSPLKAAVKVLEKAGFRVYLSPKPVSCGRALISKGMLKEARKAQEHLVEVLAPMAQRGMKIVGLEPSSILTLRDELPLLVRDPRSKIIAENSMLLEEFLVNEAPGYHPGKLRAKAIVHGHCHQKALSDMSILDHLLEKIEGLEYKILDSGCCGMAGSFGYDKDHYEISKAIGERVLFPAVRALSKDDIIVADGFSCRSQIADFCDGRRAIHISELLLMALEEQIS